MDKIDRTIRDYFNLEELALENSAFHTLHPSLKLILTFVYVLMVISSSRYSVSNLSVFFVYPAVVISVAGIPPGPIVRRLFIALPFVVFAGISNIVFDRQVVLTLFGIGISAGVLSCLVLVFKTILCVGATLILAATTPSHQIFAQLRRFRVPKLLVLTIMLCLRYLTLLLGEARQMNISYHLRSPNQRGIAISHMGSFIGQLLLRSFDRAEQVYQAMLCRGYHCDPYTGEVEIPSTSHVILCLFACGSMILARLYPLETVILLLTT